MSRTYARLSAVIFVLFSCAAPSLAASPRPIAAIKLQRWRTRWVLPVTVGGKERKLMFDTGGGITLLSSSALEGCQPWGRLTGFRMFGDRGDTKRCSNVSVAVADYKTLLPAAGFIDMGKLNPADKVLDGVAALNLFEDQAVTLDFLNGQLTVESPQSLAYRVRSMKPLKVRLEREVQGLALAAMVEVPTSKGPTWMELDSGNGGTVLVSKPVAELFGLDGSKQGKQAAHFAIAPGVSVDTEDAFTPDIILDGNLGMPFLQHWVVTLNLKTGEAWIAPAVNATSNTH